MIKLWFSTLAGLGFQIYEVGGDIGEPDCRLDDPYVVGENDTLTPWLVYTTEGIQDALG